MLFDRAMFDLANATSFLHMLWYHSIPYIVSIPFFWASMGFTTAISMIVTVTIFDNDLGEITRSAVAKLAFIAMLFAVTFQRVQYTIQTDTSGQTISSDKGFTYAGIATILLLSAFWFLGMFIGVALIKLQKRIRRHKMEKSL